MSVNTFNIASLLYDRQHIELSPEEEFLYDITFHKSGMRRIQFKRLIDAGHIVNFNSNETIFEEGTVNNSVYILISGSVIISVKDEFVASVKATDVGAFLGEMQLLESFMDHAHEHGTADQVHNTKGTSGQGNASTGHYSGKSVLAKRASDTASVRVKQNTVTVAQEGPVRAIEWDMQHLLKVLEEQDEMAASMRSVLLSTLLKKLRRSSGSQQNLNEDFYYSQMEKYLRNGIITAQQKKELLQVATDGFISLKFHYDCLQDFGWSEQEYMAGRKLTATSAVASPNPAAGVVIAMLPSEIKLCPQSGGGQTVQTVQVAEEGSL
jgi:CRP-like cAMP-binding protein